MQRPAYTISETPYNANKSPQSRQCERDALEEQIRAFEAQGNTIKTIAPIVRDKAPILSKTHRDLLSGNRKNAAKARAKK